MNIITENNRTLFMDDIMAIDFTMINLKLQDTEEGQGWAHDLCQEAELAYKKFLGLKRVYPQLEIVPNKIIDIYWHQHILDTQKYAVDCNLIFGYFMHHYPYFGMRDQQEMEDLHHAFKGTLELYAFHFNENYSGEAPKCKAPKCRTACKPMKCR